MPPRQLFSTIPIVRSKLRPPTVPSFAIERPHLIGRLDTAHRSPLVVLAVPPGSGKTVLLSQWVRDRGSDVGWLTVDTRDVEPQRFWAHLIAAVGGETARFGEDANALLAQDPSARGEQVADALIDDMDRLGPRTVIIDDLGRVDHNLLANLIAVCPGTIQWIVASRTDPDLELNRRRIAGSLTELRARDLRFTTDEIGEVVQATADLALTDDQREQLLQLTAGWPVVVRLAALKLAAGETPEARALGDSNNLASLVDRFSTDRGHIAEFLSNEVLATEPISTQRFLLDISVLRQLRGDLCDEITATTGGAKLLSDLEMRGLFVTAIDGGGGWYRYEPLVGDILLETLRSTDADRADGLRRTAAAWYLERDEPAEAAELLIHARAWHELTDLIQLHGRSMWEQGMTASVLRWIEAIPTLYRRGDPQLGLTHLLVAWMTGRTATAAAAAHELEIGPQLDPGEQICVDTMLAAFAEADGPADRAVIRGARALASLTATDGPALPQILGLTHTSQVEITAGYATARAALFESRGGAAVAYITDALACPGIATAPLAVHSWGTLALINALSDRPAHARINADRARACATELHSWHPSLIGVMLAESIAFRQTDQLEDAAAAAAEVLDLAQHLRRSTWIGLSHALLGAVMLDQDEPIAAAEWVHRFHHLAGPPPPPLVADLLAAIAALAQIQAGNRSEAAHLLNAQRVSGTAVPIASARLALSHGDVGAALKALESRPPYAGDLSGITHCVMAAAVEYLSGDVSGGRRMMGEALSDAEKDGYVRVLAHLGPEVVEIAREQLSSWPTDFVARALGSVSPLSRGGGRLAIVLTDRELQVLAHLPSRLSNAAIASTLYLSVNTVKTHVQHIYQKLGVDSRDEAVRQSREIGLI